MSQRGLFNNEAEVKTLGTCGICGHAIRDLGTFKEVDNAHEMCLQVAREFIEAGKKIPPHVKKFMETK